ncbi:MAG: FKBP-type peptidyl-prolyl cis-trans isomerase [Alistipes sp.]|nr:FKBP-type peptidyl-prolyl cis-trans isomerase [Alistipes sp.]
MKKVLTFAAIIAASLSVVACGNNSGKQIDSLSYAIGADLGLNLSLGMKDFDLDREIVIANIKDFYKNGDVEGEEIKEVRNQMMQYQYTVLMPFMYAKRSQEMLGSDQPDTLPALPELYNEEFTREKVSTMMGKNMGAAVKGVDADINMKHVLMAIEDAKRVEAPAYIDSLMRLTQDQMQSVFQRHAEDMRAKAQAEREKALKENAELSEKWLAEIEKQEGVQKTESGLLYRIDREGEGAQATEDTDVVLVNYEGKNRVGDIFDSSYERNEPISFPLNGVIKGWTEGMKLVKAGGQITLWIPSALAYGENGAGADIGPNEALEFKVELLEVNPAE